MDLDNLPTMGFWRFAQQAPQELALIDPDGRRWTRGELLSECNKIVHGLRARGLGAGDAVAILMPNSAQNLAILLAALQAGFLVVPINWHLAPAEVAYILSDSGAKAFFCHTDSLAIAEGAIAESGFAAEMTFCLGDSPNTDSYQALLADQSEHMPLDRATGMVMFYTSGTTGKPKGVRRAIPQVDPDTAATRFTMLLMLFGIQPGDDNVHFCGSPLYHTAVANWTTSSLHLGHSVVMHERWDAEAMLRAIEQYRITTAHVVPTQLIRLTKLPEQTRAQYDVSTMRHMLHTAAPCPVEIKKTIIDWFGPCVYEYYASTEGGGTLVDTADWLRYPGTVGKPWPGADIKIFDDDGSELGVNQRGTIYMLMTELSRFEYRDDPAKTANGRIGDYFTAGDIGYLNSEGFLFLCDRKIDMIISGGANIYPAEIESVLIGHPQVVDCCVFGIPNEEWGEEIKAVVQLAPGAEEASLISHQLFDFCAEKLARMKCPKTFDVVKQMPRDPNGKLYKRRLRDPYWQSHDRLV
ncbi:acyl-CoA synthetase [Gammaproteobacteria bacterium LSUCC0057]|uniref:Acyl-CoA synthetase n=1 Tax=Gammaproteobacteria bacterium LSUCC0057 TaxID=2559237 RepID=A0A4Y8UK24_9GAMM|nr:acyl-CoA synthetase [Gammaproteobacteria bacterium LSUCC0057]